jgi:hypothetical protein
MAFSVEKLVFLVERCPKTELFVTTQSDYSHVFGCPAPAKSVMWKYVKYFRQTGNMNIPKRICLSTVVTGTRVSKVSERLSENPHQSLQKLAQQTGMSYRVIAWQRRHCLCLMRFSFFRFFRPEFLVC